MPTKKGQRKETERLVTKKSSVASLFVAAVPPPPPPKERVKQQDSSIFFFTQSAICKLQISARIEFSRCYKSPTNSVAATESTLIYQKNDVDGNSGGKEGRTELHDSEDLEENECNASSSNKDDGSFLLEENESDAASGVEEDKLVASEGLVYSDDEAYLFEVESEDEFWTSFPKHV